MGILSKDVYKKLIVLYLIGKYSDGVFSHYRFQKTLYFSIKDLKDIPFEFRHTRFGEYSLNARRTKDNLVSLNLITQSNLSGDAQEEELAYKLEINKEINDNDIVNILKEINPDLATSIDNGVNEYGYLKTDQLKEKAEADPLLRKTPMGMVLLEANIPDFIEVENPEIDCHDLELSFNSDFINGMSNIIEVVDSNEFDMGEVRIVDSII